MGCFLFKILRNVNYSLILFLQYRYLYCTLQKPERTIFFFYINFVSIFIYLGYILWCSGFTQGTQCGAGDQTWVFCISSKGHVHSTISLVSLFHFYRTAPRKPEYTYCQLRSLGATWLSPVVLEGNVVPELKSGPVTCLSCALPPKLSV